MIIAAIINPMIIHQIFGRPAILSSIGSSSSSALIFNLPPLLVKIHIFVLINLSEIHHTYLRMIAA